VTKAIYIIVATDADHSARWIFDLLSHPYQLQSIAISQDLRAFFNKNSHNSINFWYCSSNTKWTQHSTVNKETKQFNYILNLPYKSSWDFSRKKECDSIIWNWQIIFQASDFKGNYFLNLLDNDYLSIKHTYIKGDTWLKLLGYSNSLYARVTRAITNHAPIAKYQYHLRFFPKENFNCLCKSCSIESRHHILHECRRFNNYWNPNRKFLSYFVVFLEFNSGVFSFHKVLLLWSYIV